MQTLGLTPQEPSEGRIKSLFWPKVANDADVDNLTSQGFWVCFIVAVITLLVAVAGGNYLGTVDAVFFYLGGNGVRQRSKAAAICVFVVYAFASVILFRGSYAGGGMGQIVRVFISFLLLSNMRAIWMASSWQKSGEEQEPAAVLSETFADRFSGVWPPKIWAKLRIVFFVLAGVEMLGILTILAASGSAAF